MTKTITKKILAFTLAFAVMISFMPLMGSEVHAASKPGTVKISSAKVSGASVTLKWKKAKGATSYVVYKKSGTKWKYLKTVKKSKKKKYTAKKYKLKKSGKKYRVYKKTAKYSRIGSTKAKSYTYKGKYSTKYTFKVRAYAGKKAGSCSAAKTVKTGKKASTAATTPANQGSTATPTTGNDTVTVPGKVQGLTATADGTAITLSWDALSGAESYEIFGTKESSAVFKSMGTTKKTQIRIKDLSEETLYKFRVRAINSAGHGPQTAAVKCKTGTTASGGNSAEEDPATPAEPTKIKVSCTTESGTGVICTGDTVQFKASISPANADSAVTWSISPSGYIDETGRCQAGEPGTYTVTGTTSNGISDTISITVYNEYGELPVTSIEFAMYEFEEAPGENAETPEKTGKRLSKTEEDPRAYLSKYYSTIFENKYVVIKAIPKQSNNVNSSRTVNWSVKENAIDATTKVAGNCLVINIQEFTKDKYLKSFVASAAIDGIEAETWSLKAAVPEVTISYEDLLEYDLDPVTAKSFLWGDYAAGYSTQIKRTVAEITEGCTTDRQKAGKIVEWFHENISYVTTENAGNSLVNCWINKYGVCGDMASLFAQMLRYADIPAGYYKISWLSHACTVFWMDGEWYTTDPTCYCKGFNYTNFSGEKYMALLSSGMSCSNGGWNVKDGELLSHLK